MKFSLLVFQAVKLFSKLSNLMYMSMLVSLANGPEKSYANLYKTYGKQFSNKLQT